MTTWLLQSVLLALLGLGSVAFITLLERKLLGLSQTRLGPNKASYLGLLQPVADGVKLLWKEGYFILMMKSFLYVFSPLLLLSFFVMVWTWLLPWLGSMNSFKYASLFYFALLGLGAYAVILTGWSSVSGFSKLGSLRGMLQNLSFEVVLMLSFMVVMGSMKSFLLKSDEPLVPELFLMWFLVWMILSLMETNRAPFDLLEGESELISGFNIEMGSLSFVYLFLSEYGMILVMALISSVVILGEVNEGSLLFFSLLLFMRSCFPRVRYDIMMSMMWQAILPVMILNFMVFFIIF